MTKTKSAYFLLVRTIFLVEDYVNLYLQEVLKMHEVPVSILSNYGMQFAPYF